MAKGSRGPTAPIFNMGLKQANPTSFIRKPIRNDVEKLMVQNMSMSQVLNQAGQNPLQPQQQGQLNQLLERIKFHPEMTGEEKNFLRSSLATIQKAYSSLEDQNQKLSVNLQTIMQNFSKELQGGNLSFQGKLGLIEQSQGMLLGGTTVKKGSKGFTAGGMDAALAGVKGIDTTKLRPEDIAGVSSLLVGASKGRKLSAAPYAGNLTDELSTIEGKINPTKVYSKDSILRQQYAINLELLKLLKATNAGGSRPLDKRKAIFDEASLLGGVGGTSAGAGGMDLKTLLTGGAGGLAVAGAGLLKSGVGMMLRNALPIAGTIYMAGAALIALQDGWDEKKSDNLFGEHGTIQKVGTVMAEFLSNLSMRSISPEQITSYFGFLEKGMKLFDMVNEIMNAPGSRNDKLTQLERAQQAAAGAAKGKEARQRAESGGSGVGKALPSKLSPTPYDALIEETFGVEAETAKRVVMAESSNNPNNIHTQTNKKGITTTDRGLFQINSVHIPDLIAAHIIDNENDLFNPAKNIAAAKWVFDRQGWEGKGAGKGKAGWSASKFQKGGGGWGQNTSIESTTPSTTNAAMDSALINSNGSQVPSYLINPQQAQPQNQSSSNPIAAAPDINDFSLLALQTLIGMGR